MSDTTPPPPPQWLIDQRAAPDGALGADPYHERPEPIEDLIEGIPPEPASLDQIDADLGIPPDRVDALYPPDDLPEATPVELPGRGTTSMRLVPGPPGAPTVLLLHGWTANSALNWFSTYMPLGEHFRVLALDHRGHGRGIRAPEHFKLQDCADDAAALVDLLALAPVIVAGYSMGGPIAQLLCRRHPDLVSGLVLCSTASSFVGNSAGERAMQGVVTGLTFAARRTPEAFNKRIADRVLVSRYDDSGLGLWAREEAGLNDPRSIVEAGQEISQFSSDAWIGRLDVPTAVVMTERDHVVAPERQQALAEAIPGAVAYRVDGDHDVVATEPDHFVPVFVEACLDVAGRVDTNRLHVDQPAADQIDAGQVDAATNGATSATSGPPPPASPAATSTTAID